MQRPGTGTRAVVSVSGAQTIKLAAQDSAQVCGPTIMVTMYPRSEHKGRADHNTSARPTVKRYLRALVVAHRRNGRMGQIMGAGRYIWICHRKIGKEWGGSDRCMCVCVCGGGGGRNLATTGGNTRREWGDVRKTTNRICMRIPLRSTRKKLSAPLTPDY